jgi:hypothetical protein
LANESGPQRFKKNEIRAPSENQIRDRSQFLLLSAGNQAMPKDGLNRGPDLRDPSSLHAQGDCRGPQDRRNQGPYVFGIAESTAHTFTAGSLRPPVGGSRPCQSPIRKSAHRLPESAGNPDSVSWPKALSIRVSRLRSDSNCLIRVAGICRNGACKRSGLLVSFTSPGLKRSGPRMDRPYRASGIGASLPWAVGPGWYGARRWR